MPGQDKRKYKASSTKSNRDQANEFVGIKKTSKKQANEFSGLGSANSSKRNQANEFAGIKKKPKIKQANEFAGTSKNKKNKVTESIVSKKTDGNKSKPKVVTPKMIKDAGFTTLRDYLNDKRGLKRKDGKKVVRTSTAKSSAPKALPKAPRGKNKIVPSLKISRSGIDGPSSSVKKKKAKTGFGSKAMTTKVPKKTKQGITRTPFQAKGKRKSMMGST
tara:strand:+ start:45 stop:698 length:654 start_codon:yes stop_codon:yes gene_type:complete